MSRSTQEAQGPKNQTKSRGRALFTALACACTLALTISVGAAQATTYLPSSFAPPFSPYVGAVAVDQTSGDVYLSDVVTFVPSPGFGRIDKVDASGSPLSSFGSATYMGVAVAPAGAPNAGNVFAYDGAAFGGTPKIDTFDSSGNPVGSPITATSDSNHVPQIATDASGNVYFPEDVTGVIQKFSPAGTLLDSFDCNAAGAPCSPAGFGAPTSVAVDSTGAIYVADAGQDVNEVQTATVDATGGTFTLTFNGQTTDPIAFDAAQGDVQTALEALSTIGAGNVGVKGGTGPWTVTFKGALAATNVSQLTADGSGLSGGASTVTVATTTPGGSFPNRVVKLSSSGDLQAVLQSGQGAIAVGVDPATDQVFVGDGAGTSYHVVGYDSSGAQFADFGLGVFADEPFGAVTNQLAVNSTTGAVYVADAGNNLVEVFTPITPTATTGAASAIAQTTATLNGTVNPNGDPTTCEFQYGPTTAYGSTAPCATDPGSGVSDVAESVDLSGLTLNSTYHYRLVATNGGRSANGSDQTLTTLPNPPTVTTGGSSGITQTAATIAATINPGGVASSDCHFEYGTSTAYGTNVPCPTAAGSGSSDVAESLALSGLTAATTYHYRLLGANAGGTANGADATFTTLADTCQTKASLCPPPPGGGGGGGGSTPPPPVKKLKCKKGFVKKHVHGKAKCVKKKKHHKHH